MKIYINKLPKNCLNCPCHSRDFEEGDRCNLGAFDWNTCDYDKIDEDNYKHENCPLQTTKTLTKEIFDKFWKIVQETHEGTLSPDIQFSEIEEIFDKIEKEVKL